MSRGVPGRELTEEEVIEVIYSQGGVMVDMANALGVTRARLYKFLLARPHLQEMVGHERESAVDKVENALLKNALAGDTTAQIFFLKTRGRKRGYSEHYQTQGNLFVEGKEEQQTQKVQIAIIDAGQAQSIFDILARTGALPALVDGTEVDGVYTAISDPDPGSGPDRPA